MDKNLLDHKRAELFSAFIDQMNAGAVTHPKDFAFANGALGHSMLGTLEAVMPLRTGALHDAPTMEERDAVFAQIMSELKGANPPAQVSPNSVSVTQRTDILILMLHFMGELWGSLWGNVKLIKLPFLLAQEGDCGSFVPDFYFPNMAEAAYNYGAFDQNVLDDVDGLIACGIIRKVSPPSQKSGRSGELGIPSDNQVDWIYELTPRGKKIAAMLLNGTTAQNPEIARKIESVIKQHGNKTMAELLDYTYNKYPDSAKNSKVKDKYLRPKKKPSSDGSESNG